MYITFMIGIEERIGSFSRRTSDIISQKKLSFHSLAGVKISEKFLLTQARRDK